MIALAAVEFTAKNIGKIFLTIFAYLAVFDVVGVILCLLLDVFTSTSAAEYYALWFVLAVFCGMLSYSTATDFVSPKPEETSRKAGLLIVFATFVLVLAASFGSYFIWWRYGDDDNYFVPDNEPLSLTFFATVLASSILAYKAFRPTSPRSSR